jgi:hypothetical protein
MEVVTLPFYREIRLTSDRLQDFALNTRRTIGLGFSTLAILLERPHQEDLTWNYPNRARG